MYVCIIRIDENRVFQVLKFWPQECCNRHMLRVFTSCPPGRRTGLTLAGKRIRKGCEVHQSGDYLNEVKMLQLCKSPYIVTLHGGLLTLIVKEVHPVSEGNCLPISSVSVLMTESDLVRSCDNRIWSNLQGSCRLSEALATRSEVFATVGPTSGRSLSYVLVVGWNRGFGDFPTLHGPLFFNWLRHRWVVSSFVCGCAGPKFFYFPECFPQVSHWLCFYRNKIRDLAPTHLIQ